jgi:MFS family permease
MGLLGTMSAVGTALGPSLGGALIAGFGWRAIFFVNLPLGLVAVWLAWRHLPADATRPKAVRAGFDLPGTVLLAAALAAYALAMTVGRAAFGALNLGLLVTAVVAFGLFALVEARAAAPLIRLAVLRRPAMSAGLATNAVVSTVMMATLVVGPFYLTRALGLGEALVGAAMTAGPVISALTGLPAGRLVDRFGAPAVTAAGLLAMVCGSLALAALPGQFGLAGYIAAIAVLTPGYQLFQAANNTAVMSGIAAGERGVVSGMLNLSRNLGLVTGASVMGAVFALATGTSDIAAARPEAVADGMRVTFLVAAALVGIALAFAVTGRASRAQVAADAG